LVGTRQVFAIPTEIGLRIRDTQGNSRFDLIRKALIDWWNRDDSAQLGVDDLTLLTTTDVLAAHGDSAAEVASRLDAYVPTFTETDSEYELLMMALDYVDEPIERPGMPSYIFLPTALPRMPRSVSVENIISRAQSSGTRIYPILFAEPETMEGPEAQPLIEIAEQTGGQVILFDEETGLTSLADIVASQRTQYEVTYPSNIVTAGPHTVQVQLGGQDIELVSEPVNFVLDVQAPEVLLIQPPTVIQRTSNDPNASIAELTPDQVGFQYLIEFPDGYPRDIQSVRLLVDGEEVEAIAQPTSDLIEWDISDIVESGDVAVQITVEDSLGISGSSDPAVVSLDVALPPRGLRAMLPTLGPLSLVLAILVGGIILAAILINFGRSREPGVPGAIRAPTRPQMLKRAGLRETADLGEAEAMLTPGDENEGFIEVVPLHGSDSILGSDPSLASVPIRHPSVDGFHARLIRQADGSYLLKDHDSCSGSWVNFTPVTSEGSILEHGDIVHLGIVSFRFELATPPPPRKVLIQPVDATDEIEPGENEA
jgi:hypothetical protein